MQGTYTLLESCRVCSLVPVQSGHSRPTFKWLISTVMCATLVLHAKHKAEQVYLQSLLEAHMGMPLDAMRQFSELSPAERGTSVLSGAHMPSRGFYRIRSVTPGQLDRQRGSGPSICGIPFWVSSRSEAAVSAPLGQGSLECEIGSGGSVDTSVVGDIGEEVAHGRAHMGNDMGELKAPVDM